MNKVILMGRLTRDPDVRYSNGEEAMAVARFTLAVDRRMARNKDGEQTADFISCVAFRKTAEFIEKYFMTVSKESNLMSGFVGIYNLLKEQGHQFVVITARGGFIKEMKYDAIRLLEENNIKFDKYYWNVEDKLEICKNEKVDIMIDDDWKIIKKLADNEVKTLYFRQHHHIKLVVPFSSLGDNVYENPYYYAINPPKSYQFAEAARLTTELFGKENVIFLEGTENDKDAAAFVDATRKRLQQNGSKANHLRLNDDEIKWMEAMTQYKDNVIIPNSSSIKLLNQLFPKLKEFTKKNPEYRIKLVGYPEWQTYANNHLENFYQFNTYAYSSFFRNPLNGNADEFENAYQKAFHTPTLMSWPRFGMLGFDTAIYFLKGISTYGEAFDQHLSQIVTTTYQHRFDFQRISNWSGFINREIEFIHYSPSHSIELIRLKK